VPLAGHCTASGSGITYLYFAIFPKKVMKAVKAEVPEVAMAKNKKSERVALCLLKGAWLGSEKFMALFMRSISNRF
jgi:hypothetical protein